MAKLLTLKAIIAAEPDANKRREVPDGENGGEKVGHGSGGMALLRAAE